MPTRILLLEDVAATADVVTAYLRASAGPVEVKTARTLAEALDMLAAGSYDLILADLNLPDSVGLDTLDRLLHSTDRLIVVLTVEDSPEMREAAIARGAYDFLHKSQLSRRALGQIVRLAALQANTFRSLRESEARFRSLTELSSDFYWETDAGHRLVQRTDGASRRPLHAIGSQFGKTRWEFPYSRPDAAGWAAHRAMLEAHLPFRGFEFSRVDPGGIERHLTISGEPVFDEHGAFKGYRGVGHDITARKQAEDQLRSAVSLLSATLESTADGILVVAADHAVSRFNRRFVDMWRIPTEILESRDDDRFRGFVLDQLGDPAAFVARLDELSAHPEMESLDTIELKDGRTFERYSCAQLVDGRPVGRVYSFRDITDRRRAEERVHMLAYHDPLTGLPNRLLFRDRMQQATAHADRAGTKVALLFLDLDNFKTINDSLGHSVGDLLLRQIAVRMQDGMRDTDTISRQGGDEFLVMLTDLPDAETATPVIDKLMEQLQIPFDIDGRLLTTSISAGLAVYPDDGEDFDVLLKKADAAMYRAKDAGKNTYRFWK